MRLRQLSATVTMTISFPVILRAHARVRAFIRAERSLSRTDVAERFSLFIYISFLPFICCVAIAFRRSTPTTTTATHHGFGLFGADRHDEHIGLTHILVTILLNVLLLELCRMHCSVPNRRTPFSRMTTVTIFKIACDFHPITFIRNFSNHNFRRCNWATVFCFVFCF